MHRCGCRPSIFRRVDFRNPLFRPPPDSSRAAQPAPIAKPMQSRAAIPKNAAAPAALAASPIVVSEGAQTPAPAAGALASSSNSAAVEAAPVPQEPASATVSVASTADTKAAPSKQAALNADAKPQQAVVAASRPVEASYAIPLAIRVGSFAGRKCRPTHAVAQRQRLPPNDEPFFRPAWTRLVRSQTGPLHCWNAASRVAGQVSIAENLRPVIGPVQ